MTEGQQEPPRTSHAEAAAKLAALLAQYAPTATAVDPVMPAPAPAVPAAPLATEPPRAPSPAPAPIVPPRSAAVGDGPGEPPQRATAAPAEPAAERRHASRLQVAAFTTALVLLVAAIPVLGYIGKNLVLDSRGGKLVNTVKNPNAPGYEAIVDPTPTALVVQTDKNGKAVGATVLALGAGDAGGSVVFVPLGTQVEVPANGVDRLSTAYALGGLENLRIQVGSLLQANLAETVSVDDAKWAELVRPVGSLTIDNPDAVTVLGHRLPSGPLTLTPDQVGPYLAATNEGESDLARLVRQKLVWEAWIKAVKANGRSTAVPGEADTGIARYIRTMAKGTTVINTLAVKPGLGGGTPDFVVDDNAARTQMVSAIPFPRSPTPGARTVIRLLNGVGPGALPATVTDALVRGGAEIASLGNASSFGQATTTIQYYNPANLMRAEAMRNALGVGKISLQSNVDQSVDVTVVVGADLNNGVTTTTAPARSGG